VVTEEPGGWRSAVVGVVVTGFSVPLLLLFVVGVLPGTSVTVG